MVARNQKECGLQTGDGIAEHVAASRRARREANQGVNEGGELRHSRAFSRS